MSVVYHAFGACYPYVGVGVSNALVALGNCAKGGTVREIFATKPREMDGAGGVPADYQAMGGEAEIVLEIGAWDDTVGDLVIARSQASGAIGALIGNGGYSFVLNLPSAIDRPWTFPTAKLEDWYRTPGVASDNFVCKFKAWRLLGPTQTTSAATALYTRT